MRIKTADKRPRKGRGFTLPKLPDFAPKEVEPTAEEAYAMGMTKAITNALKIKSLERRKAVYHFVRCLQLADTDSLSAIHNLTTSIDSLALPE